MTRNCVQNITEYKQALLRPQNEQIITSERQPGNFSRQGDLPWEEGRLGERTGCDGEIPWTWFDEICDQL